MRPSRSTLRELALTLGAALGVLCFVVALAGSLLDVRLLVFRSGSMEPTIGAGGVALSRTVPAAELATGDIVSVTDPQGVRITHRVRDVGHDGDRVLLTLQGDANPAPDRDAYPVTEADRVFVHVDHLGRVVDALGSPYGVFLGGMLAAGLLLMSFGGRGPGGGSGGGRGPGGGAGRDRRAVTTATATLGSLVLAGLLAPVAVHPTAASFTDTAAVQSPAEARRLPQPGALRCVDGPPGARSIEISTTSLQDGSAYVASVHTAPIGGTQVGARKHLTGGAGSRRSHTFGPDDHAADPLELGRTYYVRVHSHLPGTDWYSERFQVQPFEYAAAGTLGARFACL